MNKRFVFWIGLIFLFLTQCTKGSRMKGVDISGGWLEFTGKRVSHIRPGAIPHHFLLNWESDLGWAKYDSAKSELIIEHAYFGFEDGSRHDYSGISWHSTTPDFTRFLLYQGRGISFYRKPNTNHRDLLILDLKYDEGEDWMYVNPEFTKAIVPLARQVKQDDRFDLGGTPLVLFKIDLVTAAYTKVPMDHFADSYLGSQFILWRHYRAKAGKGESPTTSHFSATNFDLVEIETPLVKLLNRYRDSLPDFTRGFYISSQGWALMGVHSPTTPTEVFFLNPDGNGRIIPLFAKGIIPLPGGSLGQCAISEDGQYFAMVTEHDSNNFKSVEGDIIHLGRVEKVNGEYSVRIMELREFPDLPASTAPIWIPGTHALTMVTNDIDYPSKIRIYDLDKHPINWSKVPLATQEIKLPK